MSQQEEQKHPLHVPGAAIQRLTAYLRILDRLDGTLILSSADLAERAGTSSEQYRKDLAYFGEFGIPGRGYPVAALRDALRRILALDRTWNIALVGLGKLGSALLAYPGLEQSGFLIRALFDIDPHKVGRRAAGLVIHRPQHIPTVVPQCDVTIGIIATPAGVAQHVAGSLVRAGVRGILNFAPVRLRCPSEIKLVDVDLSTELESLAYFLK